MATNPAATNPAATNPAATNPAAAKPAVVESGITGRVFEIQRMSTEDGPGLRTTVFLKGCSLHCSWCHNPESIKAVPEIHWLENRCIHCDTCRTVCPEQAIPLNIDRAKCTGCGLCAEECPSTALEMIGTEWDADALAAEVMKDSTFFRTSGGGVTLGGGESTLQADFAAALFMKLKENGIHTALDTCGHTTEKNIRKILPWTDLVLYDLKLIDEESHRLHTGASNSRILSNLEMVYKELLNNSSGEPGRLWIRTPVIPSVSDTCEVITGIGHFLRDMIERNPPENRDAANPLGKWELLAFNNLCIDKYRRLEMEWPFEHSPLISREAMETLAQCAVNSGVPGEIVCWSGGTQ